jgi:energy-coupling factor transport system ATP-binding protein
MITVSNLTYRYPGAGRPALRDITLGVSPGESVALMGSNGSGKSTLARCLNGLLLPESGTVTVDGLRTSDASLLPAVRRSVGLVFQQPPHQMTSPTVERELAFGLENLGMEPVRMRAEVENALDRLGFIPRRHLSPGMLSGGEQQRLALAAVMLLRPRYIVLDEATSLLAGASRFELMEDLTRYVGEGDRGLLMITQSAREAERMDRIVVLHRGDIVADGTPSAVFEAAARLRDLGVPVPFRALFSFAP